MVVDLVSEYNNGHVAVNRLSIDIPSSNPVSMQDHHEATDPESPVCPIDGQDDSPPSYDADAILQSPQSRQKFNVQPREDEGRETLPPYSSAISLENVFCRKVELEGVIRRAADRNWYRVCVALQGTALTFHKYRSYTLSWSTDAARSDVLAPGKKGQFIRSYNLQYADVGIAADYYKKRYVIRVRAETDQFLLSCSKIETFVHWLQSLFAAIDIAPPLDTRPLPRDYSIPRTRRRRATCATSVTNVERNATLIREQYEIMRRQYPGLIAGPAPAGGEPTINAETWTSTPLPITHSQTVPAPVQPFSSYTPTAESTQGSCLDRIRTQPTTALPPTAASEANPSLSPETGKWRPEHKWSAMYDLMYAKQCLAILTSRSPRKSDIVIMQGKQWVVDWATGALTSCEPPDYREIVAEK